MDNFTLTNKANTGFNFFIQLELPNYNLIILLFNLFFKTRKPNCAHWKNVHCTIKFKLKRNQIL